MKVTLLGLPQAGQQQLFSLLTGIALEKIVQKPLEARPGTCDVRDPRIIKLKEIFNPKKTTFARIEFLLLPDFDLHGHEKDLLTSQMKNADELCFVVRAANAEAETNNFLSELVIYDMMLTETRLENIKKEQRRKVTPENEKEKELLIRCRSILEEGKLLRSQNLDQDMLKSLRNYQFFTLKPLVIVVNLPENEIRQSRLDSKLRDKFGLPVVQLCAEIEAEISELEPAEQAEYMQEAGIDEPAINKISRLTFEGLGLISFFTVGEDEVRAWPIRRGATAQEAGDVIHSDIAKGFVRAEMMDYNDFIAAGSEAKLKETGKFYLKGRDYIVADGDILNFRFNV
ncbi:MAG: DUF933 domain-containing protein [Candidatus Saganbacteria bacterium]|nr:DUF933 domain-containing protein [Candidatus Saganbacteria bacterium]